MTPDYHGKRYRYSGSGHVSREEGFVGGPSPMPLPVVPPRSGHTSCLDGMCRPRGWDDNLSRLALVENDDVGTTWKVKHVYGCGVARLFRAACRDSLASSPGWYAL